ncbi:fungal-specific transcription factor domain-containing protein [Xylaria nigripes]|nr:fungal-specific transcription factor domain-containing protein [Xylaria nigripes]
MVQLTESTSATTEANPTRRHCWECQRRRLVCDSVRPICNRCRNNGIVCPGYSENKPLRWVKPGRVTTRNRRRPKGGAGLRADPIKDSPNAPDPTTGENSSANGEIEDAQAVNAAQLPIPDPIMRYDITCNDPSNVEASYVYGMELYNCRSPLTILLENVTQYSLPPAAVAPFLPAPMKALFILLALGHQMYRLPRDVNKDVRLRARSAVAFWAYQVVRALNEYIADEEMQASDMAMTAVLMFLWEDQQYRPSRRWRLHFDGLMTMVQLRGGIEMLYHSSPPMRNGILTMVALEAFGNTTSPSHDQLFHLTHPRNLPFLQGLWENGIKSVYVGSICPPPLFTAIIKINHLRALSHRSSSTASLPHSTTNALHRKAQILLAEIQAFSPSAYANQHSSPRTRDKWLLIARIHQRAVLLYCIHALLPGTECRVPYDGLLLDLKEAFRHSHLRNCLFWALVVAGVCAVRGTAFERGFIADLLRESVGDMGGAMPLCARATLKRFWDSGRDAWDDCFDRAFLYLT